jgi:hypothetical protein
MPFAPLLAKAAPMEAIERRARPRARTLHMRRVVALPPAKRKGGANKEVVYAIA